MNLNAENVGSYLKTWYFHQIILLKILSAPPAAPQSRKERSLQRLSVFLRVRTEGRAVRVTPVDFADEINPGSGAG